MAEEQVTLSAAEADTIYYLVDEKLANRREGTPDEQDRALWRLLIKLDKTVGGEYRPMTMLNELPAVVRNILHQTFAPVQAPPKPKAAVVKSAAKKAKRGVPKRKPAAAPKPHSPGVKDASPATGSSHIPTPVAAAAAGSLKS